MPQPKTKSAAEGFVGSIFKYSISTFANVLIMALSIILTGIFVPSKTHGVMSLFLDATSTIMTIAILGLDQALIRFFYNPPAKLTSNGLFRVCFYFSSAILLVGGAVCSTLLLQPVYGALGLKGLSTSVVPLVFLNAFFYMIARYFNVLYRMEKNIKIYTTESILMQFFYKLFYIVGMFMGTKNPVFAMIICSVVGLGGFSLIFSFMRRKTLRPHKKEFTLPAYKTLLPYGVAIAPTAIFITLNALIPKGYILHTLGKSPTGIYSFIFTLSNAVTLIQGGFASFWGPYMFENYKTEQTRIKKVHNYINFVILVFFFVLVALEDVLFYFIELFTTNDYGKGMAIFPLMMLGAVFTILCETTVYGNAIARRPIFDTIGIALSFVVNIVLCLTLTGPFGLYGAAIAVAAANFAMFLVRTLTAQKLYSSIQSVPKTILAITIAIFFTIVTTLLTGQFLLKLTVCIIVIGVYCLLYRKELVGLWQLGTKLIKTFTNR